MPLINAVIQTPPRLLGSFPEPSALDQNLIVWVLIRVLNIKISLDRSRQVPHSLLEPSHDRIYEQICVYLFNQMEIPRTTPTKMATKSFVCDGVVEIRIVGSEIGREGLRVTYI